MTNQFNGAAPMSEQSEAPTEINLRNCFVLEGQGTALTSQGYARLNAALEGIQTINALIFQAAVDKDCIGGIALSNNVVIGLTSAISACAEYAELILDGESMHSKAIKQESPEYQQLERLVHGE